MSDVAYQEVDLPCSTEEAWGFVLDPSWLGEDGELDATPGAEGWVEDDGTTRYLLVEEVIEGERFVYRWASFDEAPTRVEIELLPIPEGTRVTVTESPLGIQAQACLALR